MTTDAPADRSPLTHGGRHEIQSREADPHHHRSRVRPENYYHGRADGAATALTTDPREKTAAHFARPNNAAAAAERFAHPSGARWSILSDREVVALTAPEPDDRRKIDPGISDLAPHEPAAPTPFTFPADGSPYDTDRNATIKRVKAALQKRSGKEWSVTGGRGTSWGWLEVDATPKRRTWQHVQTATPEPPAPGAVYTGAVGITPPYRVGLGAEDPITRPEDDPWARGAAELGQTVHYGWEVNDPSSEFGHTGPPDRAELTALLGLSRPVHHQGHSVAASSGHRRELIDRAEGRTPTVFGEQYWD